MDVGCVRQNVTSANHVTPDSDTPSLTVADVNLPAVFLFIEGLGGLTPQPVEDDPLTSDCKGGLEVGFDPTERSKIQIRR